VPINLAQTAAAVTQQFQNLVHIRKLR